MISLQTQAFAYPYFNFGVIFKPTLVVDNFSVIGGSRIGINITPNIYAGVALNAISFNSYSSEVIDNQIGKYPILALNYVAIDFDYSLMPESEYFPSISLTAGYGNMNFRPTVTTITIDNTVTAYNPAYKLDKKEFFILEPQLNLNMNFTQFYRLTLGVGYRIIPGLDYKPVNLENEGKFVHLKGNDLNGITGTLTIKFGGF